MGNVWVQGFVLLVSIILSPFGALAREGAGAGESPPEAVPAYHQIFMENIRSAVTNHPRIAAVIAARDGQRFQENEARAALYPQLEVGVTGRYRLADSFEDRFDNINQRSQRDTSAHASLTGRQLIFDGGQTSSRIVSAKHAFSAAHEEYGLEASAVALMAVQSHYTVFFQRQRHGLHRQNIERHRDLLNKVILRFESGRGPSRDVALMEARLATAEAQASTVQKDMEGAVSYYEEIYGFLPENLKQPSMGLKLPVNVQDALELGFHNSRALSVASSRTLSSKEDMNAAKADRLPHLSVEMAATKYDLERGNDDYDVTGRLVMNYSLYNGGARSARISRSLKNYEQWRHNEASVMREVNRIIKVAFQDMQSQERRGISLKKARDANQRNRDQIREQFEATGGSLFALLEAEKQYHQARESYLGGRVENNIARYRLLDAMGTLLSTLNIRLKREVE